MLRRNGQKNAGPKGEINVEYTRQKMDDHPWNSKICEEVKISYTAAKKYKSYYLSSVGKKVNSRF